eukprot:3384917-Amphidinium_carterae.1
MAVGPSDRSSSMVQWSAPRAFPFLMHPRTSQSPPRLELGGGWKQCPPTCRAEGPSFHSLDHAASSLSATSAGLDAHPVGVRTARSQTLVEPRTHLKSLLGELSAASLTNFSQPSLEAFCLSLVALSRTSSRRAFWLSCVGR